jgi:hypothetical protein
MTILKIALKAPTQTVGRQNLEMQGIFTVGIALREYWNLSS